MHHARQAPALSINGHGRNRFSSNGWVPVVMSSGEYRRGAIPSTDRTNELRSHARVEAVRGGVERVRSGAQSLAKIGRKQPCQADEMVGDDHGDRLTGHDAEKDEQL